MASIKVIPTENAMQTTLASLLDQGETGSLTLADDYSDELSEVSESRPGVLVVDRISVDGVATPSNREFIVFTGVSTTTISGLTRGQGGSIDQAHSAGAIVEFVTDVQTIQSIVDTFNVGHSITDGSHNFSTLYDANGNEIFKTSATASAVNEITITNSATGGTPSISATGGDTNINLSLIGKGTGLVIPQLAMAEGQMLNGKIVTTEGSNRVVIALKTIQGNDPSADDPIYVRIGNSIRSVTSALSVGTTAGQGHFNEVAAGLTDKDTDYFVYLFWQASSSAVKIGVARIPYGRLYSDFSGTNGDEKYLLVSDTLASSDEGIVIGRVNMTCAVTTNYWSIPATSVIIQRPIYETRWLSWAPVYTGFSSDPVATSEYSIINDTLFFIHSETADGTSNSTSFIYTVPMANGFGAYVGVNGQLAIDNGTQQTNVPYVRIDAGDNNVDVYKTGASGSTWTASGGKRIVTSFGNYPLR